jgi:hypothetical protein
MARDTITRLLTRRDFATLSFAPIIATTVGAADAQPQPAGTADLRSELLFDLTLVTQGARTVAPDRIVVPVSDGTFVGPRLKGTVIGPAGDWIVQRPDGSRLLDVRLLLQTDDGEKIYMAWRGVAYTPPGEPLYARILPMFESGAAKYGWLNNIVAVGVYRPTVGTIVYRVYQIL